MDDVKSEPLWQDYERASQEHQQSVKARQDVERELVATFSEETLRRWDEAHRAEEKCYEQVKAAERAVWHKLHN